MTTRPSGLDCPENCVAEYASGIRVSLTARPDPLWEFESWGGACAGQGNPCLLIMDADHLVTATFVPAGLLLTGPTPGLAGAVNTLEVLGATPGATIYFVSAFTEGSKAVPGCPGVTVAMQDPKIRGTDVADESGHASLSGLVPGKASGRTVLLQAVEHASCTVSNVVEHTFP
ncbi:MAG: hypothetical protein HY347_03880 [candidate division NC10 bacterium]|nr:hypothetical protein [candidate division NC10 bacterium]